MAAAAAGHTPVQKAFRAMAAEVVGHYGAAKITVKQRGMGGRPHLPMLPPCGATTLPSAHHSSGISLACGGKTHVFFRKN